MRCGAPLTGADATDGTAKAPGRRGFVAAPHEHHLRPAIVSTLFPHLPRADMRHYRWAMGIGTVIVLALGVAGLFPLALAGAALLVPTLTALYLRDVNVYEEEPLLVIGFTLAWGAVAGIVVGLLGRAIEPAGIDQLASGHLASPLVVVVLLPVLELALAVVGPALVLLPHRRYNDVLDGVTFGAASAAALSATQVIVTGLNEFQHGLAPGGQVLPWIWRLLTIRLALPILAMAVTGAACGALWLRFRAPQKDRDAVGFIGYPVPAFAIAAALLVLAAAGERWLAVGAWLAMLLVLAGLALVWLRLMLQLGLQEESEELEIGPDIRCPNCNQMTPHHTYCAECGVALRALPKHRDAAERTARVPSPAHLVTRSRIVGFAAFLGMLIVGAVVILAVAPSGPQAPCPDTTHCGAPPELLSPLQNENVWRSAQFGYQLQYPTQQWTIASQGPAGVELRSLVAPVDVSIEGGSGSSSHLLQARLGQLKGRLLGLTTDPSSSDAVLGAAIGYRYGTGGAYVGALSNPQGVQDQLLLTVQAATGGNVGVVATTITSDTDPTTRKQAYALADSVINSVTWPGET